MDISDFDTQQGSEDGASVTIKDPRTGEVFLDKDKKPVVIHVIGPDSDKARAVQNRSATEMLKKSQTRAKGEAIDLFAQRLDIAIACTTGWTGITEDKKELPANAGNIRKVYTKCPWILEQVETFIGDRTNFLKP